MQGRTIRRAGMSLVVALCWLIAAQTAGATPVPVSDRTIDAYPTSLQFDRAGTALAGWRGLRGYVVDPDSGVQYVALAARSAGGAWRAGPRMPETVLAQVVAVSPGGRIALVTQREQPLSKSRTRSLITLQLGRTGTLAFARARVLARGPARKVSFEGPQPTLALPKVAFTPDGGVLVAWHRGYPDTQAGVWLGTRLAGGRMPKPRLLGPHGGESWLGVAEDGTGLLAWRRGHRVLARVRGAKGRWLPVETAASVPQGGEIEYVALQVASGKRSLIAVVPTRRSMSGVRIRPSVHTRVAGAGWRGAVLADYTFTPAGANVYVSDHLRALPLITGEGRMRVVWPRLDGGRVRAVVTELFPEPRGLGTGPATPLSDATQDVALESAAAGPDGRFAVTWFDMSDGRGTPTVAESDAGGAVRVTPRLAGERALVGSLVAYDPVSGRPTVVWSEGGYPQGYRLMADTIG